MNAELVESISAVRERLAEGRRSGSTVGLVPTMGALHAGHARLIESARRECQSVTVSIFVNPLQFDRSDDLQRYPRTFEADLAACRQLGVDYVFAPSAQEMYPRPPFCTVDVGRLADHLCGPFRPGHFRGVATIVLKLFQIVQPDRAYFGEKDAQQLAIVRQMVNDFNTPVVIVSVPTVREADGLALSSRNRLLQPTERRSATALYRALREAEQQISSGLRDVGQIKAHARTVIPREPGLRLEYFEVVDPENMQPVERIEGPVRVAGALWVGTTRLIDNLYCTPPRGESSQRSV
ncbi:MAG: pantoate--beta-alanine ligase [Blastocatellia bacterium]|nr:MAG: pantoate--beta-alanine ligase [Blastocatellia bacterium]